MQNLPNDLNPVKQTLWKALKQVEVSDHISPQPESHLIRTPSIRPSQTAINTNIDTEPSAQISKDLTIMQVASPLPAGNDNTVAQSCQDDSKNLNAAGVAVAQNDNTIVRYSGSAICNPADRTVCQAMLPSSIKMGQTVCQRRTPQSPQSSTLTTVPKNQMHVQLFHPSIFRDVFRASGSFTSRFTSIVGQFFHSIWRKIDLKQLQSRFHPGKQLAVVKTLEQPSSSRINRSTHDVIASGEQPSLEQYEEKLRELDFCRFSFAKELARNGKFRHAIAMAEQISETSHFFKDSQRLIQSWKQF